MDIWSQGVLSVSAQPLYFILLPLGVFHVQLENAARKRERSASDTKTTEQKQEKKRLKTSQKLKATEASVPSEKEFTPYDYSQSDFKAFAGENRPRALWEGEHGSGKPRASLGVRAAQAAMGTRAEARHKLHILVLQPE